MKMAFRAALSSMKSSFKCVSTQQWVTRGFATSSSRQTPESKIYELRMYSFHPDKFKTAIQLFNTKYELRTKYSKVVGFWNSEIGDNITQFVHIWEYDSLSHRRTVRTQLTQDEAWNKEFLPILFPTIDKWKNSLMVASPGSKLSLDFNKDPKAVYLLESAHVNDYKNLPMLTETHSGEHLVGRFIGLLGQSKTEYRLWRYEEIDKAMAAAKERAMESPFDGSTMILYPTSFSPLQ